MSAPQPPRTLQQMSPEAARFCLAVDRFMGEALGADCDVALPSGTTILCALSGGVDSIVLTTVLNALAPRRGWTVLAAHLDHGLRPESGDEAEASRAFCAGLGIDCISAREHVTALAAARGVGLEEAARLARYAFLVRVGNETQAQWIAMGHQLNDLAEDVLMRLTRGSGWPQLGGMRAVDAERRLMRPLLLTPRTDIETFARALGLPWSEDPSNRDRAFLRNRMRHDILPLFLKENPNFLQTVAGLWRSSTQDREFFSDEVDAVLSAVEDPSFLPRQDLADLPRALRLRVFKACLEALGSGQPTAEALNRLDEAFTSGEGGKTVQFPGGKEARLGARGVAFSAPAPPKHR